MDDAHGHRVVARDVFTKWIRIRLLHLSQRARVFKIPSRMLHDFTWMFHERAVGAESFWRHGIPIDLGEIAADHIGVLREA
jgi:hypothetical protein